MKKKIVIRKRSKETQERLNKINKYKAKCDCLGMSFYNYIKIYNYTNKIYFKRFNS